MNCVHYTFILNFHVVVLKTFFVQFYGIKYSCLIGILRWSTNNFGIVWNWEWCQWRHSPLYPELIVKRHNQCILTPTLEVLSENSNNINHLWNTLFYFLLLYISERLHFFFHLIRLILAVTWSRYFEMENIFVHETFWQHCSFINRIRINKLLRTKFKNRISTTSGIFRHVSCIENIFCFDLILFIP